MLGGFVKDLYVLETTDAPILYLADTCETSFQAHLGLNV